jgi:hypothetical protein
LNFAKFGPGTNPETELIYPSSLVGKSIDFPKSIQCYFFVGSGANWTLLSTTTYTLYTFSYNSVS